MSESKQPTIHFVLMGKGGVGKSLISSFLYQYLSKAGPVFSADTDPNNQTLCKYKAINAKHINIATPEMNIDKSRFDELMENLLGHEGDCVVDNGASSFMPMMAYMLETEAIETLQRHGKRVLVHAPLIGGQGYQETLQKSGTILQSLPCDVVIWENQLFGPVLQDGKGFLQSSVYEKFKSRILGVVNIVKRGEDTFGKDMYNMTSHHLTFDEVAKSDDFRLMSRQRLALVERDIEEQLDKLDLTQAAAIA